MKRIIGWTLIALFIIALLAGLAFLLALDGQHWTMVVFAPLGTFIAAVLLIGFVHLVAWLLE